MLDDLIIHNPEKKMRRNIEMKDTYYDALDSVKEPEEKKESWPLDDALLKAESKVKGRVEKLTFVPRDPHRGDRLHRSATIGSHSMAPFFFLRLIERQDYVDTMSLIGIAEQINRARVMHKARGLLLETKSRHTPLFPGEIIPGSLLRTPYNGHGLTEAFLKHLVKRGSQLEKLYVDIARKMQDKIWKRRYSLAVNPNWSPPEKTSKPFKKFTPQPVNLRDGYATT